MQYDEFRAMNTDILVAAEGLPDRVAEGFQVVRSYIAESEIRFTRFSEESELSQLNRTAGGWFIASPEMFEVVQLSRQLMELTCGLFDPSILGALREAGYDRSMDEIRASGPRFSHASPSTHRSFWPAAGFSTVEFKPAIRGIHLPPGVQIDLGGVVKGWIAEQAATMLAQYSHACTVNSGGDMFLAGIPEAGAWQVGLEDPRNARVLAVLRVPGGAVVTSSLLKRRWVQDGQLRHHIIDPRTGQAAETDWLSVTVIADHTATAEAFAKALLIAGSERSRVLAERQPGLEFIGVKQDGSLWGSSRSMEFIDVTDQLV